MVVNVIAKKEATPVWGFQTGAAYFKKCSAAMRRGTGGRGSSAKKRLKCDQYLCPRCFTIALPSCSRQPYFAAPPLLYYREVGQGQPIIVLHGGPDFDHNYLLPDMDRLSDSFHLIYYDQRGRGKSVGNVQPADVSIQSEIQDLESLRQYFQLETIAVLGHSWGGLLAMEYAVRHPNRVSHLILMNTAPASGDDYMLFRQDLPRKRAVGDLETLKALSSSAKYEQGGPTRACGPTPLLGRSLLQPFRVDLFNAVRYHDAPG